MDLPRVSRGVGPATPGLVAGSPVWERAVRQTETARPTAPGVLIHRDVHPGNLLWTETFATGVVDWVNACVGPAAFDTAHLRLNLACLDGLEAADAFDAGDPAWDIEAAFGLLDWASPGAADRWAGPWAHVPGRSRGKSRPRSPARSPDSADGGRPGPLRSPHA